MKNIFLFFAIIISILSLVNCFTPAAVAAKAAAGMGKRTSQWNPLYDPDVSSAIEVGRRFDVSTLTVNMTGFQFSVYDVSPAQNVSDIQPGQLLPENIVLNAQTKEVYINVLDFVTFVNETNNFQTVNYLGNIICFHVDNYNWATLMAQYSNVRSFYRVSNSEYAQQVDLKRQIDDLFGRHNKICQENVNAKYLDINFGTWEDASAPGPNSGAQKAPVSGFFETSSYAEKCYGKQLPVIWNYMQYFVGLNGAGISSRNIFQASIFIQNFTAPTNTDYRDFINTHCQNSSPYPLYFNSDCPFPLEPNIPCGSAP